MPRLLLLRVPLISALLAGALMGMLSAKPAPAQTYQGRVQGTIAPEDTLQRPYDTLYVRAAVPSVAHRGDTVAFLLSDSLRHDPSTLRVSIGGLATRLVTVHGNEIVAVVPSGLESRDTLPKVTFYLGTLPIAPFDGLTIIRTPIERLLPFAAAALAAAFLVFGFFLFYARRRASTVPKSSVLVPATVAPPGIDAANQPPEAKPAETAAPRRTAEQFPVPAVPEPLVKAIVNKECALFAGAGLSAPAGYPTWTSFVAGLLQWAIAENHVDEIFGRSLRAALGQGGTASVADTVVSAVPPDALLAYLQQTFAFSNQGLPPAHERLRSIGFCAAFTTNFDSLLERTFADGNAQVLTPSATDALREALTKNRFFTLKLYGTLDRPDSVMVSPAQFRDAVSRNRAFSGFMDTVFLSRTLLFLGASLDGIQTYLDGLGIRADGAQSRPAELAGSRAPSQVQRTHYALVSVADDAWRAQAEVLRRRYNIEVLPYTPDEEFTPVAAFLGSLEQAVKQARGAGTRVAPGAAVSQEPSSLEKVHLENIGPFEVLDLNLHRNWNVFLGDNGVGKSTILRAIGLALCGIDGQRYAGRLVRIGQAYGKIVLSTGRNVYFTEIFQRDGEAEVLAQVRPFEAEGWLPLGFSPIRTVTWERPKGPTSEGKPRPTSEDVLPLVRGDVDPRMNNVKQWLVNLDYYAKDDASKGVTSGRYARLQQDFDSTIKALLNPMQFEICVKDAKAGLVTAITADGEVPIESVSQGTASLLGWIGVLIQRLYEVFDEDAKPRDRYALVMLDEIDAHMHPAWQRSLVSRLAALFPNVQFIATTHSPLIVGGMPPTQLFRFARDASGKVARVELEEDTAMGRSDQVLRGQLFDLPVTLDAETEKLMAEYQTVLADRDPKARKREAELEKLLGPRIPSSSGDRAERRAHELVEAVLREQLFPTPEASKMVSERVKKLLDAAARSNVRR